LLIHMVAIQQIALLVWKVKFLIFAENIMFTWIAIFRELC